MRRSLPPLNPLRSFEAAARYLSYTLAAEELNVTQVAVSRQVRVLEDYLEVVLFERGARTLRLTDAGVSLLPIVTDALDRIEAGISVISMHGRSNALSIQVYVTFAQGWLIPRLRHFRELHPNIDVNLRTSPLELNFERQGIDAAIISSDDPPEAYDYRLLADRALIPVCSPDLLSGMQLPLDPAAAAKFTLLHSLARPGTWQEWLAGAGHPEIRATKGLRFETSVMALHAALSGMGLAVGIRMLIEEELRAGLLVAPFEHVHISNRQYYIVWPKGRALRSSFETFLVWLMAELPTSTHDADEA
jgi:LysR family glycine cleavage system transcriptional activator